MITITWNGKQYVCLEHMKEIKATENGELFKKWYNKKQMFKALACKPCEGLHGTKCGSWEHATECMMIEVYELNAITSIEDAEFELEDSLESTYKANEADWAAFTARLHPGDPNPPWSLKIGRAFFVKDDDGKIFYFMTDID